MSTPNPTPERRKIASDYGIANVDAVAQACLNTGLPFHLGLALVEGESPSPARHIKGGANIYGHDHGGVFSTNDNSVTIFGKTYAQDSDIPVTARNFALFLIKIFVDDLTSNGVGPGQATYKGHFPAMIRRGLRPWVPVDSLTYLFEVFQGYLKTYGSISKAGAVYNGGTRPNASARGYGDRLESRDLSWQRRFGLR